MTAALLLAVSVLLFQWIRTGNTTTNSPLFMLALELVALFAAAGIFIYVTIRLLVSGAW